MRISTAFTIVARFEAFTWAGLLVGMYLKHVLEITEVGVWFFGRLHGFAFVAYCIAAVVAGMRLQWPWWATLLALLASIPPLTTLAVELWFRKIGLLEPKAKTAAAL